MAVLLVQVDATIFHGRSPFQRSTPPNRYTYLARLPRQGDRSTHLIWHRFAGAHRAGGSPAARDSSGIGTPRRARPGADVPTSSAPGASHSREPVSRGIRRGGAQAKQRTREGQRNAQNPSAVPTPAVAADPSRSLRGHSRPSARSLRWREAVRCFQASGASRSQTTSQWALCSLRAVLESSGMGLGRIFRMRPSTDLANIWKWLSPNAILSPYRPHQPRPRPRLSGWENGVDVLAASELGDHRERKRVITLIGVVGGYVNLQLWSQDQSNSGC